MEPNPDNAKDYISHSLYWERSRFVGKLNLSILVDKMILRTKLVILQQIRIQLSEKYLKNVYINVATTHTRMRTTV